ncbi:MAG: ElyC/SanA/YdcF family protein [Candidatus Pedobacter colombiensis]|uniref:ElyC/SanA/YdcF family protein n=1 Tax=Candidatus Pedobacter colombiensis TaxID=3121371 RepID=A0AAJ5WCC6_9SPHI|nr:ElyC/SanA/YdcF family protein [Pedobacter sp.]WEK20980.1 MAG: ElyC/SanA/YdcF family protein [Pedobacter sp.]
MSEELQREILKVPASPDMDMELISALTSLCFQEESLVASDILFVFGSNVQHREIADIISYMLNRELVNQVLITGGIANYNGSFYKKEAESEQIKSHIPLEKYTDKKIYIENRSRNIIENIVEARKIFSFENINSITFLSHSYASTRASLSLKRFFPGVKLHCIPLPLTTDIAKYPISRQMWSKTVYGRDLVWGEYLRLQTYGGRGDFPIDEIREELDHIKNLSEQKSLFVA